MTKVKRKPSVGNKVIGINQELKPEYKPQDRTTPDGPNQDFKKPNAKPPKPRRVKIKD